MKNSTQIFSSFLVSVLLFCAAIFVIFNFCLKEWEAVGETRMNLAERQATINRLEELISKFREQLALFDDLNQQVEQINSALPSSLKIPEILVSVGAMAEQNNISIKKISFSALDASKLLEQIGGIKDFTGTNTDKSVEPFPIAVSIDATGNYLGTKNFLKDIEGELRLMDVNIFDFNPEQVEFGNDGKPVEGINFVVRLNLDVYSIKKPQFTLP